MKIKVLTTCNDPNFDGYLKLKSSLEKFGYDYECIVHPFTFGKQLGVILNWCNNYQGDCTHILYTDAYDTLSVAPPQEVNAKWNKHCRYLKMLISCEKACYPHPEKAVDYPYIIDASDWRYVNGGGWLVGIEYFKELCKKENLNGESHDQIWLRDVYLNNKDEIGIDTECRIFQSIAFENKDEFAVTRDGRVLNRKTNSLPIFIHNNGGQMHVPKWVHDALELQTL